MVNNDIVGREVINMIKLYIYSLKCMTFIKLNTAAAFIYFLWGAFSPSLFFWGEGYFLLGRLVNNMVLVFNLGT